VAGIVALFKIGPERRKMTAEAFRAGVDSEHILSNTRIGQQDALMKRIDFLSAQLDDTQAENTSLREEMRALRVRMTTLESVITQNGLTV
jgi:peptidoglycan hydrolase CwlO-like protein